MFRDKSVFPVLTLPAALMAVVLTACGGSKPPEPATPEPEKPAETAQAEESAAEEMATEEVDAAAELAAREEELAKREAELTLKEREAELARREAQVVAREAAAKKQSTAPKTTTAAAPAAAPAPAPAPAPAAAKSEPTPMVIPAGTQFSVQLTSPVSTKTAKVGDPVNATLVSDIMVNGKVAVPAGSTVQGSVTEVVSGSQKIGGTPTLGMTFSKLNPNPDTSLAISGNITQAGKSETGKDAAKIAGGALIGGVIGHQIDHDKGRIIGGLLGAAGGAVAAQKTGGEVEVPAGSVVGFVLDTPVEVK